MIQAGYVPIDTTLEAAVAKDDHSKILYISVAEVLYLTIHVPKKTL